MATYLALLRFHCKVLSQGEIDSDFCTTAEIGLTLSAYSVLEGVAFKICVIVEHGLLEEPASVAISISYQNGKHISSQCLYISQIDGMYSKKDIMHENTL